MNFEDFKKLTPEQRILLEQSEKTPEERVVIEQLRQQLEQEIQEGLKNFIHADHQIDLIIDRVHLENTETIDRIKQEDQVQQQLDILNQLASEEMQKIEEKLQEITLSPEVLKKQNELINALSNGYISNVQNIINMGILSPEHLSKFYKTPEVITATEQGLVNCLSNGYISIAQNIINMGILSKEFFTTAFLEQHLSDFTSFIELLETHFPILLHRIQSDPIQLFSVYIQKDQLKNAINLISTFPWIADTFLGNEKYAGKLIGKIGELDDLSQQNIDFLFSQKQSILKQYPDIDPDSAAYRILVQDALLSYEDNQEILENIHNTGVHTDTWLSYDIEQSFLLGKPQDLSLAEMVQTPVERISETLNTYKTSLKTIFGQFQKELQTYRIPLESIEDLQKEIVGMQEKINEAITQGNNTKAQGMEKGLISLQQRLQQPKTAPLWQKITGDFDAIVRVGNDTEKAHVNLLEVEQQYKQIISQESLSKQDRDQAFEYKKQIDRLTQEFKEKIALLEMRMHQFKDTLPELCKPCLGIDRTIALSQELNEQTLEALDHFRSDVIAAQSALEQFSSETEKTKLDGRFLKIAVWGRNPDRDLYLGNYTDCCIRIDSDHMGNESTIADYLTDVGIQVITIVDETTNEPIVAAWTYIGTDGETPKMVIDNIEANRAYAAYFSLIKEQLHQYILGYAQAINIDIKDINQGQNNNDITLDVEVGDYYYKLGGYNRVDGYYLEAEPEDDNEYEDYDDEDEDYDDEDEEYYDDD